MHLVNLLRISTNDLLKKNILWNLRIHIKYQMCDVWCVMHAVWCFRLDFLWDLDSLSHEESKNIPSGQGQTFWVIFQNWQHLWTASYFDLGIHVSSCLLYTKCNLFQFFFIPEDFYVLPSNAEFLLCHSTPIGKQGIFHLFG